MSEAELEQAIARVLALPDGLAVGEVFVFVGECRPGFAKSGVLPVGEGADFEILVAQTMIDLDLASGPPERDLARLAQIVAHVRLLVAGSRLAQGPYGDLFYRVLIGWGATLDRIGLQKYGAAPKFDEDERLGPPLARMFLNQVVSRFDEALRDAPTGTTDGDLVPTLGALAADLGHQPPLIAALVGASPMVMIVHAPVPDWPGSLTHTDFMEATLDPVLAQALSTAEPI
ncbi:MAG TPA: hypothetical protein VG165_07610 [Solirubrobacteraceae bacterium]|nr:hypothetical protein [Solirubrobacteraceae bacterium]